MTKPRYLIYLHGFNSSPQSLKAQQTLDFVSKNHPQINLIIPELAVSAHDALSQIKQIVDNIKLQSPKADIGFVGSSMGGFLATKCSELYNAKAVLINPAVAPHRLITHLIGEHTNPYSGKSFSVTEQDGEELAKIHFDKITSPANFWVLLQQGDETLNYRDAAALYQSCRITLEPLGDHGFVGFNRFLHAIVEFLFEN